MTRPVLKKICSLGEFSYGNKNLTITIKTDEVWEVTKEFPKSLMIKKDDVEFKLNKPQAGKLWEYIYE